MVKKCFLCRISWNPHNNRSFHKFPRESRLKQLWLNNLWMTEEDLQKSKVTLICSDHFSVGDIYHTIGGRSVVKYNSVPNYSLVGPDRRSAAAYPKSTSMNVTATCDWCLQEGVVVYRIKEKLWRFWGIISKENPMMESLRNICEKCNSRYEEFSTYIESCKSNESQIEATLTFGEVEKKTSINIDYHSLIKEEEGSNTSGERETTGFDLQHGRRVLPGSSNFHDNPKTTLMCSFCDKLFSTSDSLKAHSCTHTDPKQFTCPNCDERFSTSYQLNIHSHIHKSAKSITCPICNEQFSSTSNLSTHLRLHKGEKPFTCPVCDKKSQFSPTCNLGTDLRPHKDEKPFTCPLCGFSSTSNFSFHKDQKSFTCRNCGERFSTSYQLNIHSHIHKSAKSITCPICNKQFSSTSNLGTHLRLHKGEKPFTCQRCDRSFATSYNLKTHLHVHATETPFICLRCKKSYCTFSYLKRHKCIYASIR